MTTQDTFTADEWKQIAELPGRILGAAAIADGKNIFKLAKEAAAGGSTLSDQIAKYPANPVVQAFANDGSFTAPKEKDVDAAVSGLLDAADSTMTLVRSKATAEEAAEVGTVLTAVATATVNAAGGGFFGGGSEKVDPREQAVLDRLATILGVPSSN